jgi:signal transduction histidine kinase
MIKTKLEIQEQAQKNIIQEIHDNIGQILSLAKLHLATLDFTKPEEVAQKTFNSNQLLSKAIKDLRNLTKYLDAEHINRIGLSRSLEYELGFLPKERVTEPVLAVTGHSKTLSKEEELILFRIIQEVIASLLRKSSTSILSAMIQYQPASVSICIHATETADRQKEPDDEDPVIKQLHERSMIIGANLQISYKNNQETTVCITLPLLNH